MCLCNVETRLIMFYRAPLCTAGFPDLLTMAAAAVMTLGYTLCCPQASDLSTAWDGDGAPCDDNGAPSDTEGAP